MSLALNVEILGEFKQLTAATKGAEGALGTLNKTTASISRKMTSALAAIGLGFSLRTVINELEEAGKAAVEDVKSQGLLANQMRNTTKATDSQIASVEKQISKLQLSASVADDQLRPAFSTLLRVTKDSGEAMKLLTLATNVSAGSGKDLTAVTMALSKAYQGKMAALTKLGIPMSDSIQAASDYAKELNKLNQLTRDAAGTTGSDHVKALEKVAEQQDKVNRIAAQGIDWQKDLGDAFAGAAEKAANLDPYMRMQIIFGEMQEQIGMALLPLLDKFSKWLATPEGQKKLQQLIDLVKDLIGNFSQLAQWVLDNKDWLVPMVAAIGSLTTAWNAATGAIEAYRIAAGIATAIGVAGAASGAILGGAAAGAGIGGYMTQQVAGQTSQIYGQGLAELKAQYNGRKTTGNQQVIVNNYIKGQQSAQDIAKVINRSTKVNGTTVFRGGL